MPPRKPLTDEQRKRAADLRKLKRTLESSEEKAARNTVESERRKANRVASKTRTEKEAVVDALLLPTPSVPTTNDPAPSSSLYSSLLPDSFPTADQQTQRNSGAIRQRLFRQRQSAEELAVVRAKDRERKKALRERLKEGKQPFLKEPSSSETSLQLTETPTASAVGSSTGLPVPGTSVEPSAQHTTKLTQRVSLCRMNQTPEKRKESRDANKSSHKKRRGNETYDVASARRESNASALAEARGKEGNDASSRRRNQDAVRHATVRNAEPLDVHLGQLTLRNEQRMQRVASTYRRALRPVASDGQNAPNYLGAMIDKCSSCKAVHFKCERPTDGKFTLCCYKGRVMLPPPGESTELIKAMLTKEHPQHNHFMENIIAYNGACCFISSSFTPPISIKGRGPLTVRVEGQIVHFLSPVEPKPGERRYGSQLYVLDEAQATQSRLHNSTPRDNPSTGPKLREGFLRLLDAEIRRENPYAKVYESLRNSEKEERQLAVLENRPLLHVGLMIHTDKRNDDQRRYNQPTSNDVACVFKTHDGGPPIDREYVTKLIVPRNGDRWVKLNFLHPMCDPLAYVLLFPKGDQGWSSDMLHVPPTVSRPSDGPVIEDDIGFGIEDENGEEMEDSPGETEKRKSINRRVTLNQFYGSKFAVRPNEFNSVLHGGRLTQLYAIDGFLKGEGSHLKYLAEHQEDLRAASYHVLNDFVQTKANRQNCAVGEIKILPSSFIGGERYMKQAYQDAMAIVGRYGKPDLFITMTCNPKWREITENLFPGQTASDRPDIVTRVFNHKLKHVCRDLQQGQIFGKIAARIHVIEFQKRGLPHAHMLIKLRDEDMPETPEDIDLMVSAEIPDKEKFPTLFDIITSSMIHGPCGEANKNSPCMEGGSCTKDFPKPYAEETIANFGGYPLYRRRDDGKTYTVRTGNITKVIDNQWVVPYNPYLCSTYQCHINVEVVASLNAVKYLFAYVYKGHDCANIKITTATSPADGSGVLTWDEIATYENTRHVAACEAMQRIFKYPMTYRSHAVIRLPVHLPEQHVIFFAPGDEQSALRKAKDKETRLTAWFKLNQQDVFARKLHYRDIPEHYTWNGKSTCWVRRKRVEDVIGRIYTVSISDVERYCLRLLVLGVMGPTSFEDIKTFKGKCHPSFKAAAISRNLLSDDKHLETTMREASAHRMPSQLRDLFAMICVFGSPQNGKQLFEDFLQDLSEDFIARHSPEIALSLTLHGINLGLRIHGKSLADYGIEMPNMVLIAQHLSEAFTDDVEFTREDHRCAADLMTAQLNQEQSEAYSSIMEAIYNPNIEQRQFFLDGPGGTGKTFLYNAIAKRVMGRGDTVITVASTGIAATLLINGKTYHSQFKLYPPIDETTSSKISPAEFKANEIRRAKLVIWDEATMTPSHALNAIDKLFRVLFETPDVLFGGMVILLGGDFRQCLPIVPHGHRVSIIQAAIKSCPTWPSIKILRLTRNMRTSSDSQEYADWLRKLGDGELTTNTETFLGPDMIEIPEDFILPNGENIISHVYGGDGELFLPENESLLCERAILCPKNEDCREINFKIVSEMVHGELRTYKSIDSIDSQDPQEVTNFPTEFLNTLEISGLPQHCLRLKEGSIIMVLKNIDSRKGLCNGARLFVRKLTDNLIKAEHATGKHKGKIVFIPKMTISPSDADIPFTLKRYQFPVVLAFAITINKSQGQTFKAVGIHLSDPVFGHGQLYVAFSRATLRAGVKVFVTDGTGPTPTQGRLLQGSPRVFTKNVVYREILQ